MWLHLTEPLFLKDSTIGLRVALPLKRLPPVFFDQEEAQAIYTDDGEPIPSEDFVNRIFDNLFNRAPAEAGLEYWSEALDEGDVSQAEMILAVANGATGDGRSDTGQ